MNSVAQGMNGLQTIAVPLEQFLKNSAHQLQFANHTKTGPSGQQEVSTTSFVAAISPSLFGDAANASKGGGQLTLLFIPQQQAQVNGQSNISQQPFVPGTQNAMTILSDSKRKPQQQLQFTTAMLSPTMNHGTLSSLHQQIISSSAPTTNSGQVESEFKPNVQTDATNSSPSNLIRAHKSTGTVSVATKSLVKPTSSSAQTSSKVDSNALNTPSKPPSAPKRKVQPKGTTKTSNKKLKTDPKSNNLVVETAPLPPPKPKPKRIRKSRSKKAKLEQELARASGAPASVAPTSQASTPLSEHTLVKFSDAGSTVSSTGIITTPVTVVVEKMNTPAGSAINGSDDSNALARIVQPNFLDMNDHNNRFAGLDFTSKLDGDNRALPNIRASLEKKALLSSADPNLNTTALSNSLASHILCNLSKYYIRSNEFCSLFDVDANNAELNGLLSDKNSYYSEFSDSNSNLFGSDFHSLDIPNISSSESLDGELFNVTNIMTAGSGSSTDKDNQSEVDYLTSLIDRDDLLNPDNFPINDIDLVNQYLSTIEPSRDFFDITDFMQSNFCLRCVTRFWFVLF